jgi:hypothetical protein
MAHPWVSPSGGAFARAVQAPLFGLTARTDPGGRVLLLAGPDPLKIISNRWILRCEPQFLIKAWLSRTGASVTGGSPGAAPGRCSHKEAPGGQRNGDRLVVTLIL